MAGFLKNSLSIDRPRFKTLIGILLSSIIATGLFFSVAPPVTADTYPPVWGTGTVNEVTGPIHFAPAAWPSEPANPVNCGVTCGDWKPYTRFQNDVADPRVQDPSNGGTAPQNYVNIASSCIDKTLPSIYYYLYKHPTDQTKDVIFFRWRVEQIANNYATGPSAGSYSSTDPWSSALWSVLFDIDGDGFLDLAAHLDGSSGAPSTAIDRIAGIWSKMPTQSLDYLGDPNVKLIAHNPTAFISPDDKILNFHNTLSPDNSWPNGSSETSWDYGTTRAKLVSSNSCNEYFVDYQIPVRMLDASSTGPTNPHLNGPKITRSTPISMIFCTANSLNNPFQKDCALKKTWVGSGGQPAPFGDYLSFDQTVPYAQPIVSSVTASAPTGCPGTYTLTAKVQDTLGLINGVVVPSVKAVDFYYWYDANGDGDTTGDAGSAWTKITPTATLTPGSMNTWTVTWDATLLPKGKYLIGVQAIDTEYQDINGNNQYDPGTDISLLDDGMTPTEAKNRTISYLGQADVDALKPWPADETWYANPDITGTQTALIGVALNNCGKAPTLTKSVSNPNPVAGGTVDFTITIVNNLLTPITLSQISDILPAGFSFNSNQGGTLTPSASPLSNATGTITWTFPNTTIAADSGTATLIFRANVTSTAGNYNNSATASTSFGVITSDPVAIAVDAARISIAKTPSTYIINPDGVTNLIYTISYSNDSTVSVTNASISDLLPGGVTYVGCSGGSACGNTGGTATWTLGTLAGGASGSVTLTVTVNTNYSSPSLTNSATITGTAPDSSTVTKTASSTISVNIPLPAFTLTKTAGSLQIAPAGSVVWTISYKNYGTGNATGVTIADTLPEGFTYNSCTGGSSCSGSGRSVSWTIGSVSAGSSGSVTVTATAAAAPFTYPNPATNTATITWTGNSTGVTSTAQVGVTGQYCSAVYYFHQGADNNLATIRPATTTAPTSATDYTTVIAAVSNTTFDLINQVVFNSPAMTGALDLSNKTLTVDFNLSAVQGGTRTQVVLEKISGATTTTLATSSEIQISNGNAWYSFTANIGAGVSLAVGDKLQWRFQFRVTGGTKDITFHYDSITYNSRSSVCTPSAPASLILSKTVDKANISSASGTLTYVLTYANPGGTQATGVNLADTLPSNVTCSLYTSSCTDWSANPPTGCSGWTSCSGGSATLITGGTLNAGASGHYAIQATVGGSAGGTLTNSATLSGTGLASATATAVTTVGALNSGTPALSVSKSASKTLLSAGDTVTYTLTVVNIGTAAATNVQVSDTIPSTAYFSYVSSSITGGDSNNDSGNPLLTWTINDLAVGASATLTFQMSVSATGVPSGMTTKDNSASASSNAGTVTATSNTVTVTISGNPNLSILKAVAPSGIRAPGDTLTYTITVTNNGSASASDVVVTDPIPSDTSFKGSISASQGTGSFDAINNRVVFSVGTLAASAGATLSFQVTVNGTLNNGSTTLTNTATETASNDSTKTASASSTADAAPVLTLTKSGPASSPYPAATLTAAASAATTLFVTSSAQLSVGQYIKIGSRTAQIVSLAGSSITVDNAITAPINSPVIGSVTYDILYQNTGNANSSSTIITDTLPAGPPALTYFSASPTPTSNPGVGNSGAVTWNLGTLAPGASGTVRVIAFPSGSGTTTNSASINSSETSSADTFDTIFGGLLVSKTTSTPTSTAGSTAGYIITVTNTTSSAINGVDVTDLLPSGFTYKTGTTFINGVGPSDPASYESGDTGRPIWTVDVPDNGIVTIEFLADIAASVGAAIYQNGVELTKAGVGITPFDPLLTTEEDVTILAVNTGILDGYVYRRNDSNTTFDPSVDVPYGGVKVTIEKTGGDCNDVNSTTCYIVYTDVNGYYSRVLPSGDWIVTVVAGTGDLPGSGVSLVVGTNPTTVTVPNQGSVSNDNGYSQLPDLGLSKTNGVSSVTAGGTTTYTLTVSNSGNNASSGLITVVDLLPGGLEIPDGAVTLGGAQAANWSCSAASNVITCTSSTAISASGSSIFSFTVNVSASASGTVVNKAQVGGGGDPTNGSAPTATTAGQCTNTDTPNKGCATDTDTLTSSADLSITKTDGVTTATPGGSVTYTITASNAGPSDVTGATVADTFPASLTPTWTCVGAGGGTCTASGSGNINDTVNLPAGGSVTYTVSATISASATGTLSNTATVTPPVGVTDPAPANNSATDTDTLSPFADLVITKTGPGSVTSGSDLSYTVSVRNNGSSGATNVVVTDPTPGGLTFVSAGVPCNVSGFPCTVGTIASGDTVSFTVTYHVPLNYAGADPIVNTAAVSSDVPDPDPTNNDNSSSTPVDRTPSADLSVVKTGPSSAAPGSTVTYQIIVTNNGPDDAHSVSLADTTPSGLTFVSATAPCSGGFPCSLGTVNAGASVALNVTYSIPGGYTTPDPISNTATVSSVTSDPNTGNNSSTAATPIGANPVDLAVVKTGPAMVVSGNDVMYQIKVTNNGPGTATGILLSDSTPAGLTFGSATAPCVLGFPCSLSNMASGASTTVTVTYNVPGGYAGDNPIVNTATVSANETDSNPANNTSSAATGVGSETADLSVIKTGPVIGVPGEQVTFQIVVTNNGPGSATGITLSDTTPAGLTFVSASAPCSAGFGSPCNLGTLVNGSSITVNVTYSIPGGYTTPDPIVNTASVSANEPDPNTANNSDDAQVGINDIADLSITKTDGVTTVNAGGSVTYTVVVSNAGPSSADGAIFKDVSVSNLTVSGVTCGSASGGAVCPTVGNSTVANMQGSGIIIPTLPSGGSVTFTVTGTAGASGSIVNTATVTAPASITDPDTTDNSYTDTDTINPMADLSITKSDGITTVNANGTVTYTIVVSNAGPSSADGAIFKDASVSNLTVSGVTCGSASGGAACPAVGSTTVANMQGGGIVIPTLPSGGSVTFTVTCTAGALGGSIVNTATVTAPAGTTDPDTTDNSYTDTDTISVVLLPDLTVSKSHTGNFSQGQIGAQYTITVSNQAGAGAVSSSGTTVTVTDTLPVGLTPTAATGTNWSCGIVSQTVTCSRSAANNALNGGSSYPPITITVNVAANAPASLTNAVSVSLSGQSESNTGNNSDSDDTTINQSHVFDPPSGMKTVNDSGYPELQWKMVWINDGNATAMMVRVTDNIGSNTSYIAGSLQCIARGTSITSSCAYDSANRRITWQGNIGPDPGALNEAEAQNEVVITYRTTVAQNVTQVENRGCANWDTNGNGSLDEINQGQTSVCTDDPVTPPSGDPTVWIKKQPVAVPTLDEWGMIIFMLLAGLLSVYYMRRKAMT